MFLDGLECLNSEIFSEIIAFDLPFFRGIMFSLNCKYCNKEFKVHKCKVNIAKYCSKSCYDKAPRIKKSNKVTLICKYCNKEFKVKPYRAKTAICCSRACLWHITLPDREPNRLSKVIGIKAANNKQISITCKICGKVFLDAPSRKDRRFCSRKCMTIARRKNFSGKRNKEKYITVNGVKYIYYRYILEQHLNRKLSSDEHVHHINFDHSDNRIENLEVLSNSEHAKKHSLSKKF